MSLTPTQLAELQSIVATLSEEFPHNQDLLWDAAIRLQVGDLGPTSGSGGLPAFEAAVADIKACQDEVQDYQGRTGSPESGFDVAVLQVVPPTSTFPSGNVGDIVYLDVAPNSYLATDQIQITPAGPNSVQMDEVGTTVARTVPAASGGFEVNNLSTGIGFERVLTTSDSQAHNAEFVTMALSANIPNERVLTAGTDISIVDGGAGGNVTINSTFVIPDPLTLARGIFSNANDPDLVDTIVGLNVGAVDPDLAQHIEIGNSDIQSKSDINSTAQLNLNAVGGNIFIGAQTGAGNVRIFNNGEDVFQTIAQGIQVLGAETNDPSTGGTQRTFINLQNNIGALTTFLGHGIAATTDCILRNAVRSGLMTIEGVDSGNANTPLFRGDPDGQAEMFNDGTSVARTLAAAAGGLEANNTLTGAGFERVLTASDAGSTIQQISYLFDTATAQADPGVNTFRYNNAVAASITFIYIDDIGPDGQDIGAELIAKMDDGMQIRIQDPTDVSTLFSFLVTGPAVDFTGFYRIPVAYLSAQSNATLPTNGATLEIVFDFQQLLGQGVTSGNQNDMLYWNGNNWAVTGSGMQFNPNSPAIGGRLRMAGNASSDPLRTQIYATVGNSTSGLWFTEGSVASEGFFALHVGSAGAERLNWGWDTPGGGTQNIFYMTEALRLTIEPTAGLFMAEKAADHGNVTGFGEFWVRNTLDGEPMFTDELGVDSVLNAAAVIPDPLLLGNGSAGAPTYSFSADPNTGIFGTGNDFLRFAVGGAERFVMSTTSFGNNAAIGPQMMDEAASSTNPVFVFQADEDTGIGKDGANQLSLIAGAKEYIQCNFTQDRIQMETPLFLRETSSANTDLAAYGQIWVEDGVNRLMFTDDLGNDHVIGVSGGTVGENVTVNNSFNFNTAENRADNWIGHYFDGGNDTLTLEDSTSEVNWPLYTTINIIAPGSGVLTVTEGSGTTLFLADGSDSVGGVTISQGVASITRQTAANYIVWGSGIT